ncbi:MAG: IPT/TIG domain-containing protein [Acidobacteriota bacterium]
MMTKRTTSVLLLGILASGPSRATTFMGFGDSITYGINSSWGEGYITIYRIYNGWEMPAVSVANQGLPDELTADGLARLNGAISQTGATHVFIMEGTNDISQGYSTSSIIFNLETMAGVCIGRGAVPVVGSPPPRAAYDQRDPGNAAAQAVAQGMQGFAASNGYPFASVFDDLFALGGGYLSDKVHPNDFGYYVMARSWHHGLRPTFGDPTITGTLPDWGDATTGAPITIDGTGLVAGMQGYLFNMLDYGNTIRAMSNVVVGSSTQATADTPEDCRTSSTTSLTDPATGAGAVLDDAYSAAAPAPSGLSIAPTSVPAGTSTTVFIAGTNLQNYAQVYFGSTPGTNFAWGGSTAATIVSPPLPAGLYDVTYVNPDRGQATISGAFASLGPAPTISACNPPNGDNSASVPISVVGTNFDPGATLFLGATQITPITVTSSTQIDATVPAAFPEAVYDVIVTNPDTQTATLQGGYSSEVPAPVVTSVIPSPVESGTRTTLTIDGDFFKTGATVTAGATNLVDVVFVSAQELTAVTPQSLAPGTYDVTVMNASGKSGTLPGALVVQDTTGPSLVLSYPEPGQTGAPAAPRIDLWLHDAGSGVDVTTLSLEIDGVPVTGVATSGGPHLVHMRYQVGTPFTALQNVSVRVQGFDLGLLPIDRTITFTVTSASDADGDTLPTEWEAAHALDDASSAGAFGAAGDPDRDALDNQAELAAGSDPTSRAFLLTAPGPGSLDPSITALALPTGERLDATLPLPYGGYGLNVALADVNADGARELLTGPGPSPSYGPQVRGFLTDLSPIGSLNFFAYGTLKFGVKSAGGTIEGGQRDVVITGPGPGAVFGPQIRAFRWNGTLSAISKVNFFAYATLKYGVNPGSAELDADGYDEIVTGAPPGPSFGPHVRGFNYDGATVTALAKVSFYAFGTLKYGAAQASGDVDGDGFDEILCAPGPSIVFTSQVRGFNYDGQTIATIPSLNFVAFTGSSHGAKIASSDLDGDRRSDVVVGYGEDPTVGAWVRTFRYTGAITMLSDFYAWDGTAYGVNVASGDPGLAP